MKNFKLKRLLSLALIGGLTALNASTVFAAAGDTISNTVTLSFNVSGVPQTPVTPALPATFVEDRKINFTVAEVGAATTSVSPSETLAYQTFIVTNNGNAPQDFLLAALEVAGNPFSPTAVQVFVDTNATGTPAGDTFLSGTDTGIFIDELAAGDARTVYIVSTIPAGLTNGWVATMSLVAQIATGGAVAANETAAGNAGAAIVVDDNAHFSPAGLFSNGGTDTTAAVAAAAGTLAAGDTAGVDTVFADAAGTLDSAGAADATYNGQHSANDTYTVSAAVLTVTKAVTTLWDPVNGGTNPKAIPGAYVQYVITVANAGPASASLTTLADTLATTLLDPNLILSTATFPVPTANTDAASGADGNGIRVNVIGSTRAVTAIYCTGDTAADGDGDGCSYPAVPVAGDALGVNLATVLVADATAPGYLAGEIHNGESVTITFNAIVQ